MSQMTADRYFKVPNFLEILESIKQESKVIYNAKIRGAYFKDINDKMYHVDYGGLFCQESQDELERLAERKDILFNPEIGFYQMSNGKFSKIFLQIAITKYTKCWENW